MRLATLALLGLASALPASGQDAVPDATPPWTYDPVAVGNVRWYEPVSEPVSMPYVRIDSPASVDTLGERWVVRRTLRFGTGDQGRTETRRLVRYDTTSANVLTINEAGEVVPLYPCRLDLPILDVLTECGDGRASYAVEPDAIVRIGDDEVRTSVRAFDDGSPGPRLAAGIGLVYRMKEGRGERLVHAAITRDTLGALPASFPQFQSDPTAPWRYFPLSVGDEWQYVESGPSLSVWRYTRTRVTGQATVEGRVYAQVEESEIALDRMTGAPTSRAWRVIDTSLLRYDTLSARVVDPEGRSVTPCPFDEPLNGTIDGELVPCFVNPLDPSVDRYVSASGASTFTLGDGTRVELPWRSFEYAGLADGVSSPVYTAGIGLTGFSGTWGLVEPVRFLYASVRQGDGTVWEVGARAVADEPLSGTPRLGVSLSPNPASGTIAVALTLPEVGTVTVEAFDVRGRRVARTEAVLPAGAQRLDLDASDWAPGLYVVRVTAGDATASGTVVRR